VKAVNTGLDRSEGIQANVWKDAIEALKNSGPPEKSLFVASLNNMIDIATVRTVALTTHPPAAVFAMLAMAVISSTALAGYTMSISTARDWMSTLIFALILGTALYVILDYEFPRFGLMRVDPLDQLLVKTLEQMK
jgi:hypothetical protein